ncbi:hypothetical protein AW729_02480 [Methanosphaera sp. BMS]|nr:Ig-like domain repeat protein [Methanosphaera sp. BMS]AWX32029.1 hypothetical protein AW729_02480 [Methanosphaera sp. BMS]
MVNINNITITNCHAQDLGGAIYNERGNLTINNSNLTQNTATGQNNGYGGAIYNNGGTLTITDSNLTQNNVTGQYGVGGAIFNDYGGNLTITESNLTQNTATGQIEGVGGAIYNTGNLNITQSNLTQNNATGQGQNGYGGAIHNNRGTLNITQSNLTQNTATGQTEDGVGGAIYNWEGTLHINNTNLTQNTATGQNTGRGGAIYNRGNLNITQSNLTQNNATGQTEDGVGGAIYNYVGTLTITQSNLTQNTATGQGYGWGGAIYNNGTLNITHSNLTQNTATGQGQDGYGIGGAIYNNGTLNITHSNLTQNTATGQTYDGYGGAIYNGGTLNITHSNLTQNTATGQTYDGRGGAIYDASWSILTSITSSNFINNTAPYGAAIYADGNVSFTSNTFKENTATNNKETIDLNGYWNGIHEGNNYESTDIALKEIKLNIKDDQTIFQQGDEVVLNYSIQLTTPMNYWDFETGINDITLYINNEKNKTTKYENTTLTDLQPGTYEIYYTTCNRQSNKVTFTVYYPDTECNVTNYTLLVQAIENATNNPYTSYKINLQPGDYNATQSINWENSATRKIIINGNGQTLNGQKTYQFIKIAQEHNLTLTNLTITNYTAEEGGAIYNSGTLKIDNSILEYNNATRGGAIYNNNGEAFIESNYFIANPSQMTETAIINDGTATIENNEGAETSTYNGTIYTNSTYTVTIEDNKFYDKLNTTINISTNNTNPEINDVINITFTLKDLLDRPIIDENITITIKDYTTNKTTDITGTTSIEHTIKSNETLINATYPGNNNYNTNTTTLLVTAPKIETKLIVDDADTKVGQNFTITGTLLDKDNQPLSIETVNISVNGSTKTATTNTMGQFNTTFTLDQMGEYQITVIYPGTDVYNQSTNNTAKVTATKTDTKLTLTVSNDTPVNNTQINITATLTDTTGNKLANQNITIKVSDKTFTVKTNNNGIATQTYTPTKVEKQTITTTYKGDSQYVNSTATTTITVKKINTKLTVKVSNTTPVNSTSITITVTLTDADNNKLANQNVTLNVAGKTFNLITNSNGIATQTYTPTKVEKQTITATYKGDSKYNNSTATTNITVKKINTKLDLKISNTTPVNNTPINITVTLTDADNNKLANQQVTLNINGKSVTAKTNNNGIVTQTYTPTKVETQNITATYKGDSRYNNSTKTIKITVKNKIKTQTTVNSATGVIGEKLTIKATVTDTNGGNVNEGNLIFKVNGVTIKDNGKLTGSNNPLKIKIVNGVATATIIPDINMTNAKNITAYYVGTTIYNASTSSPASINISKRNATIEVTTNKKIIKQGQVLRITAKIYDTTNGKKTSNITKYQDEYVYFKVNGITLKDTNGEMLKVKIVNGTATVNYTIPLGISCVTDMQTLTPKNHTIQVGLYNKNYQNIMTKTPTFQVERSNITINLANATINNKTHTLSMKITIKDYLGNVVAGPNKCIIKVNCVTLKNGTNVQYYYTTDGVLDLKNIPVPQSKNYTSIEVITQDRLAYNSQRNTTKVIKVIN